MAMLTLAMCLDSVNTCVGLSNGKVYVEAATAHRRLLALRLGSPRFRGWCLLHVAYGRPDVW